LRIMRYVYLLIPIEAALRNEIIPPGVLPGRRAPSLACLGSRLWQPKGAIDASGES
jgi:hypothetical protein